MSETCGKSLFILFDLSRDHGRFNARQFGIHLSERTHAEDHDNADSAAGFVYVSCFCVLFKFWCPSLFLVYRYSFSSEFASADHNKDGHSGTSMIEDLKGSQPEGSKAASS